MWTALATLGLCLFTPASACNADNVREFDTRACLPYARAVWMPHEARGYVQGMPYALGLARLNRICIQITGHDQGGAPVVPVLWLRTSQAARLALMPTWRDGDVGASVIVSLNLGR